MKLLLVGYGKMGRLVEQLAPEHGCEIAGRIDVGSGDWSAPADVAVDFSTAEALRGNFRRYLDRGLPVVIGTTGWSAHEAELRRHAEAAHLGVVAAANFSIGVHLFLRAARALAAEFAGRSGFDGFILEEHHAAKLDAPSGTARVLQSRLRDADREREYPITSIRAGAFPGTHMVTYDGPYETIVLSHTARSREGFAAGALAAAEWLPGRPGVHTLDDMLFGGRR